MAKLKVGLYGNNGHQIQGALAGHPEAELAAVARIAPEAIPESCGDIPYYGTLQELLADPQINLVSLCSPRRADQAADAIACLEAGKHVYAEKPCALTERDLDAIIATAAQTGMQFHEMAATVVSSPYMQMRQVIRDGAIGDVVQIFAQKCYPWHDGRPDDEQIDGGLTTQAGIYLTRFAEHIAGVKINSIKLGETTTGNPRPGGNCRMAASLLMTFRNGGVGTGICNYLNPIQKRCWGYEILRVFGTHGIVESTLETGTARLMRNGEEPRDIDVSQPSKDYMDLFIKALNGNGRMPLAIEDELSPTRWIIRAREHGVVSANVEHE